jgi:hypothetical protein
VQESPLDVLMEDFASPPYQESCSDAGEEHYLDSINQHEDRSQTRDAVLLLSRSFQQSEEIINEEERERFNNSFNLNIANAGNVQESRIRSLIRIWCFTGEVGRVLKSRFENGTWGGIPSSRDDRIGSFSNQPIAGSKTTFISDCRSWLDLSYILTLISQAYKLFRAIESDLDLEMTPESRLLCSGKEIMSMRAQQDISLINLGNILEDLYQGFMRLRELRGYDIARRYGALWRVIQQGNPNFDPAMAIPEILHSIWPWSNRPPLAVILFVYYMFPQILPENAKTVQQDSLGQLSNLQMVDEADLEPLRCMYHTKASHTARLFSRFQADVWAGFLHGHRALL